MKNSLNIFLCVIFCFITTSAAQDSLGVREGEISISAAVNKLEVPLNRSVTFTLKIEWKGKQNKYAIGDFENPQLTNLIIRENSSSNIVEDREGTQYTVKLYNYILEPLEIGMAYIDGIIVEYTDTENDTKNRMVTKRLSVEVIRPVEERDWSSILTGAAVVVAAGILIFGFLKYRNKKEAKKKAELEALQPKIDVETKYLEQLKETDSKSSGDYGEKLNKIVVLFRNYLTEKFETAFEGKSHKEIIESLKEKGTEEDVTEKIEYVYERSEVLRFSGQEVTRDDYLDIYGTVEWLIEKHT